jgi:hypothetical protein
MITERIETDAHFWCASISMIHLAPRTDGGIDGDVQAQGGMCYAGAWEAPITLPEKGWYPVCVAGTAQSFADDLADILGVTAPEIVSAIGQAVERAKMRIDGTL